MTELVPAPLEYKLVVFIYIRLSDGGKIKNVKIHCIDEKPHSQLEKTSHDLIINEIRITKEFSQSFYLLALIKLEKKILTKHCVNSMG